MTAQLNPNVVELLNNNTEPMVGNFNKIVSWLLHGQQSEHKMPPALLAFLEEYAGVKQKAEETEAKLNTALELIQNLNSVISEQAEVNDKLKGHVADLISRLNALETADTKPKKRAKKDEVVASEPEPASEPQPAQEPQATSNDSVVITAQAVGAGEIDSVGLGEISNMIDAVIGNAKAPGMATL